MSKRQRFTIAAPIPEALVEDVAARSFVVDEWRAAVRHAGGRPLDMPTVEFVQGVDGWLVVARGFVRRRSTVRRRTPAALRTNSSRKTAGSRRWSGSPTRLSDVREASAYRIGRGSKPNHAARAVDGAALAKTRNIADAAVRVRRAIAKRSGE